ncbi:MAG: RluA family pseudouridine synthase [Lewinellaceae bacterium]|nr:RluA family pseudouridine synthase [Phaeodactylibacter sp.]MCB9037747.1 RluA family pseudouridine synthase [Lewinellaceae bacterium]
MKNSTDLPEEFPIGGLALYKNNQLIAFNKPAGLPVQEDKTGDKALINLAEIYCKSKLHLIHRLDRPASGVTLFAKTTGALASLNEQFRERQVEKTYLVAVHEKPPKEADTLVHFLKKEGRSNRTRAFAEEQPGSKRAELSYRYLGSTDHYHLLEIRLHTGRHHQVRAQLAAIGCPIKGDVKYGARRANPGRSIHLHAWKLRFRHPVSGEWEEVAAPLPEEDPVWQAFQEAIKNV